MKLLSSWLSLSFCLLPSTNSCDVFPNLDDRDSSQGQKIILPPRSTNTGLKQIPDAAHPFKAPGLSDQRGPCPGLNTMANHGYISRNGITSFEELIDAAGEAFNMDRDLAAGLAAFGMMARGNTFTNQLSIGGPSTLIPPLPDKIDGPITRGLATHGRFEGRSNGDVSMTRQDAAIGDNRNFQVDLYDMLLLYVGRFGDDSPDTGNNSIVTTKVMQEFKFARFIMDQKANPELVYHVGRLEPSYGEAAFTLNLFANGTTGILSVPTMGSFFRNQTFPKNWHRRSSPATFDDIAISLDAIYEAHPISPGANAPDGTYIEDGLPVNCPLYNAILSESIPAVLGNTTGVLRTNTDLLTTAIFHLFSGDPTCVKRLPGGAANV